ncbi:hypothetical protein BH09MYX1_BH09MYX1_60430 [soil metagenome]
MRARETLAVAFGAGTLVLAILGCGTANDVRIVHATGEGGELAIVGDRNKAAPLANAEMARICAGNDRYRVVEEIDVPLADGGTATPYATTDYRLRFVCVTPSAPVTNAVTAR